MPTTVQSFWRDANRVPITQNGLLVTKSYTFSTTGTNAIPIFGITGSIQLLALYGVVTTALANHTAASWETNDQTAVLPITKLTGTSLTNAPAGSLILANVLAATALTLKSSVAGALLQPAAVNAQIFSPNVITQKTGGIATNIEYVYTTSDNPTTGAIQFFAGFIPLSSDGNLVAL